MKTAMKNLAIAVFATLAALFAAELALRLLNYYQAPPWPVQEQFPGYYHADPDTGYRLWPSTSSCERYPERGGPVLEVVSNADGFRSSRELGEPDARPRVLVLGDSFVFGLGVEEGERFTEVLERLEPRWRVDNLGMTGYGVDLMLRALEALGPKAKPDVVVLAVYTHDFVRLNPQYAGMGYVSRKFRIIDGELRDVPLVAPVGLRRLRLWQAFLDLQQRRDPSDLRLNEALFERFRALTRDLGAQPVALFLPGKGFTPDDQTRAEHLRAWSERSDVPFRDLSDGFARAGIENTFIPDNYHWDARGHRLAAEILRELLLEKTRLAGASAALDPSALPRPPRTDPATSFCRDRLLEGEGAPPAAPAQ